MYILQVASKRYGSKGSRQLGFRWPNLGFASVAQQAGRPARFEWRLKTYMGLTEISELAGSASGKLDTESLIGLIDHVVSSAVTRWRFNHSTDDFFACEAAARRVRMCALAAGSTVGAGTGAAGLAAMPADVLSGLIILAGTVQGTALAYGFSGNTQRDKVLRLHAIDLAMHWTDESRIGKTEAIDEFLVKGSFGDRQDAYHRIDDLVDALAPRVLKNLVSWFSARSSSKIVPIASAAIGGWLGYRAQNAAWSAAAYTYRERWRAERRMLPPPAEVI